MSEQPISIPPQSFDNRPTPPDSGQAVAQEVRSLVTPGLAIDTVEIPHEPQLAGVVVMRGQLQQPSAELFPKWLAELNRRGYTPLLRPDPDGPTDEHVVLRVMRGVVTKTPTRATVNIILFVVTLYSTFWAGAQYELQPTSLSESFALLLPPGLLHGWPFALTLLGILTAHEFGHYFAARYHKVAVTLPFFIPLPPPVGLFGTLGAFIRLKEPISDRRKLFDIGVAGPLAGLVLAVPLLFIGLSTSPVQEITYSPGAMLEGNSILYFTAKYLVFGQTLPNFDAGVDVYMNQVTWAAWIGLLVTALNLLPVGQLDGGHTVFALFGERARVINLITLALMAVFGVAGLPALQARFPGLVSVGFTGWFIWIALILLVIRPFHPPALDDVTELDAKRRWLGYFVILVFILTFTPVPLRPLG